MAPQEQIDGHPDPIIRHILRRLERVEKRLRTLERETKSTHLHPQQYTTLSQQFTENVSIIGLKEAALARHSSVKYAWLLFFFMCLGCTGFFVYKTCNEYFQDPTATKVKLVDANLYGYPAILLCPDTWLDAVKAIDDGLTESGLQYALGFLINYFVNPPPYRIGDYNQAREEFARYYKQRNFKDLVQFFKWISLDSEQFFHHCPFCRNRSFEKIIMGDAVCYQVPMHATPGNAPIVSSLDTLEVVVPDRSRGFLRPRSYWRLYLGLDLHLGEATRRYAEIYAHQMNTIQFVTHKFVSVDTPDNPCTKLEEAPPNYSYARCVLQCYIENLYGNQPYLMTACSKSSADCDNTALQPNKTYQFYTYDLWEQLASIQYYENTKEEEAPEHCYKRCPSFCERMIYTIDVQSHLMTPVADLSLDSERLPFWAKAEPNSSLPPANKGVRTPANLTRISFLNTAAVYGGVLTFTEVSTYSFQTMVGNVGGMLSLWMGVSIMSLIQVLMFLTTTWLPGRNLRGVCKRSSAYDSSVSPTAARRSPIVGTFYCRYAAHRSSSVV